jgi:hypothetical protein
MDSNSDVFRLISAVIIGAAAGAVMAALLLAVLQKTEFAADTGSFYLTALVAAVLPLCLDILRKRDVAPEISEAVMIVLSALICFGYVQITAVNDTALIRMNRALLLVHLPAVLVYAAQWAVSLIRQNRKNR